MVGVLRGCVFVCLVLCASAGWLGDVPDPVMALDMSGNINTVRDVVYNARWTSSSGASCTVEANSPKGTCGVCTNTNGNNYYLALSKNLNTIPNFPIGIASRTVCIWGKNTYGTGAMSPFVHIGANGNYWQSLSFGVYVNAPFIDTIWTGSSTYGYQRNANIAIGDNWVHMCHAFNATSQTVTLYVNGTAAITQASYPLDLQGSTIYIGYMYNGQYGGGKFYEFLAFNTTLTQNQVQQIYNHKEECSPFFRNTTAVPVARVDMTNTLNQGPREIVTQTNFTRLGSSPPVCGVQDSPFGKCGVCTFSGSGYLSYPSGQPTSFRLGNDVGKTMCVWVKPSGTTKQYAVSYGSPSNTAMMAIGVTASNIYGLVGMSPSTTYEMSNTPSLGNVNWGHVCLVHDAGSLLLYVNGTFQGATGWSAATATGNYLVGAWPPQASPTTFWNGQISGLIHYNEPLSAPQIQSLFNVRTCTSYNVDCTQYSSNFVWMGDKCGCLPLTPNNYVSTLYPQVTSISYTSNTLNVEIKGPMVSTRVYTSVAFDGATSAACSVAGMGSYWTQTFANCNDTFTLRLPWVNHTDCGFALGAPDSQYLIWKGKVVMSYTEQLSTIAQYNTNFTRSSTQSYDIYLSFTKSISVRIGNFTIWSVAQQEFIYSGETYDPKTQTLALALDSIIPWSSKMDDAITIITPTGVNVPARAAVNSDRCPSNSAVNCIQRITFTASVNAGVCSFSGVYRLNGTVWSCRNGTSTATAGCIPSRMTIIFTVISNDICAQVSLIPRVTGTLGAFLTTNFADNKLEFWGLDERPFFYADITAGAGNTLAITFLDIWFIDSRSPLTNKTLLANQVMTADGTKAQLTLYTANKYFQLLLARNVFNIPINTPAIFTFFARMEIMFAGNFKRTVEAKFDMGDDNEKTVIAKIAIVDKDVAVVDPNGKSHPSPSGGLYTHKATEESEEMDFATVVTIAGVAGLCALVVGIVGAAAYFRRQHRKYQQEYATVAQH